MNNKLIRLYSTFKAIQSVLPPISASLIASLVKKVTKERNLQKAEQVLSESDNLQDELFEQMISTAKNITKDELQKRAQYNVYIGLGGIAACIGLNILPIEPLNSDVHSLLQIAVGFFASLLKDGVWRNEPFNP
jgi:hypothetical protein